MNKRSTRNADVRIALGSITYNEIAPHVGVTKRTLINWFNHMDMNEVQRGRVMNAIEEVKKGKVQ